jgi:hypothetical protein
LRLLEEEEVAPHEQGRNRELTSKKIEKVGLQGVPNLLMEKKQRKKKERMTTSTFQCV